jgi:hypothetical protein
MTEDELIGSEKTEEGEKVIVCLRTMGIGADFRCGKVCVFEEGIGGAGPVGGGVKGLLNI